MRVGKIRVWVWLVVAAFGVVGFAGCGGGGKKSTSTSSAAPAVGKNAKVAALVPAAVRSKGKWYRLSFVCKTSADHMSVLSFDYKIGDAIPKEHWEEYNLFD